MAYTASQSNVVGCSGCAVGFVGSVYDDGVGGRVSGGRDTFLEDI